MPSGAAVTFRAGSRITLGPGFTARNGAYFHAQIGAVASYALTVINGSTIFNGVESAGGSSGWTEETTVGLRANTAPTGQHFAGWTVVSGACTLTNASIATTSLIMGANDVTVRADYSTNDSSATHAPTALSITVNPASNANPNGPIVFTGIAHDDDGDLSEVTFHINSPSGSFTLTRTISPSAVDAVIPQTWIPSSALMPGTYTVQLTARDLTGLDSSGGPSATFTVSTVVSDPVLIDDGETQLKVFRPW